MKKLFHTTIQAVQQKSLVNFNKEQELAAFVADLVIAIYSIESTIIRTEKEIVAKGEHAVQQKLACTKVYVLETSQQMALRALNSINHIGDGEMFLQIPSLLIASSLDNIFELKREIADFVIENNGYRC